MVHRTGALRHSLRISYQCVVGYGIRKVKTRGQGDLAKAAPNDPAHIARAAELSRVTDRQKDTAIIGNNSLHLIHSTQLYL